MVKYKCPQPGCKYTSDKSGECCGKKMVKASGKDSGKCGEGCSCC